MLGIEFLGIDAALEVLNPAKGGHAEYVSFWVNLFETALSGFWSRVFATGFLIIGIWLCCNKKNFGAGFIFIALAMVVAYGYAALSAIGVV